MSTRIDPLLGRMIRGYCLEEQLGKGSVTTVYRARTQELWLVPELIMTIILIPRSLSPQARARFEERFTRLGKMLIRLRHSFLFPLYGYGVEEGIHYLITPETSGTTLSSMLQKRKQFSPSEILPILNQVAAALSYIHKQGLTYQILQPANIVVQNNTNVQVTGLGFPHILGLRELESVPMQTSNYDHLKNYAGIFMGSPYYLAPELVKGAIPDARSDVYSLGIILFEMLSGQVPFSGNNYVEIAQKHMREPLPSLHEMSPDVPVALELIVNRALHRTPDRRFQTPDELVSAYAHVLDERLRGPQYFSVVQTIEKIRSLPMPTLSPGNMLAAPKNKEDLLSLPEPAQTVVKPEEYEEKDDFAVLATDKHEAISLNGQREKRPGNGAFDIAEEATIIPHLANSDMQPLPLPGDELPLEDRKTSFLAPFQTQFVDTTLEQLPFPNALPVHNIQENQKEATRESAEVIEEDNANGTHTDVITMAKQLQEMKERLQARSQQHSTTISSSGTTIENYHTHKEL